jgi:serine/threonine-protein kinase
MNSPVKPGDIVMDRYRVDRVLGVGGMGIVLAATHIALQKRVAIKFMLASTTAAGEQYERFLREARASVRLKSEHVARVSDVGTMESGAPYMVMEYLDGRDLAAILADQGPFPIPEAIDYVLQACEAVGEAHAAGIVHRDLKPANLFLTTDAGGVDCVKVLDFGISKAADSELALTKEATVLGSPLYMSPEQMKASKDADARSDIWSLGVLLYELIAGTTPFHADQMQALCARVFLGEPTPIATFRADVPPGLEAAILQCLEKDRTRRWRNVGELAAVIAPFGSARASGYAERVAGVLGIHVEPARVTNLLPVQPESTSASAVIPGSSTLQTSVLGQTGQALPRSRRAPVVLAALGGALLVVAALGVMRWRSGNETTTQPALSASPSLTGSETAPDAAVSVPPAVSSVAVVPTAAPSATPSVTATATSLVPRALVPAHVGVPPTRPTAAPSVTAAPTAKPKTTYEKD